MADTDPLGLRRLQHQPRLLGVEGSWELGGACSHLGFAPDVLRDLAQITSPPCFGFAVRNASRKQIGPCSRKVSDASPAS